MEASIAGRVKGAAEAVLDWFYPPHCYHCGESLAGGPGCILCGACYNAGRQPPPAAVVQPLRAARTRRYRVGQGLVHRLSGRGAPFRPRAGPLPLCGPAGSLITSYKFGGEFYLGRRLLERAWTMGWGAEHCEDASAVVPVPLHARRERERGYDQGVLLARTLGHLTAKPVYAGALRRVRYTEQRTRLTAARRRDNVRGAFRACRDDVRGLRVLLVDDVMTTGATANECSRILKKAGAEKVYVLAIGRYSRNRLIARSSSSRSTSVSLQGPWGCRLMTPSVGLGNTPIMPSRSSFSQATATMAATSPDLAT